ncbi:conserved hypothetical protein [Desulfosarcina cetonica]|nr:conserved hypothetical protein [Desulfosarcina cetonica]
MKIMICGKGGSGKSTLTTLLARELNQRGKTVLVVDADESNLCLHRLLGARMPDILMDAMGGRKGVKEKLTPSALQNPETAFLKDPLTLADIPAACLAEADGIKLLVVGKIQRFGEGCACMIGNISKTVLSRLRETANEVVLIDAEAGLEHFGRRVDAGCDLILCVVDPSYESFALADNVQRMAGAAGIEVAYVLNKVNDAIRETMTTRLDAKPVVASIPHDETLFTQSFNGEALDGNPTAVEPIIHHIETFKKPINFNVL